MIEEQNFEYILRRVQENEVAPLRPQDFGGAHPRCTVKEQSDGMFYFEAEFQEEVDPGSRVDEGTEHVFVNPPRASGFRYPFAVVTGRLSRVAQLRHLYAAPIKCILYGADIKDLDHWAGMQKNIESVRVASPVVARLQPSILVRDLSGGDSVPWDAIFSGEKFAANIEHVAALRHGQWACDYEISVGAGGIAFNCMWAKMPVGDRDHAHGGQMAAVRELVDAWRILLTLLQGGGAGVALMGAEWRMRDGWGRRINDDVSSEQARSVPIWLPLRPFGCLDRLHQSLTRYSISQLDALDRVGMAGVRRWCEWYADFMNRVVVRHWLFTDEFLGVFPVLEGVGRRLKRSDQTTGDVHFVDAIKAVLKEVGLSNDVDDDFVAAMNEANNKLVKHIGDLDASADAELRDWWFSASRFAALLVGYALLKVGVGDIGKTLDDKWRSALRREIEEVADASAWPPAVHRAVERAGQRRAGA